MSQRNDDLRVYSIEFNSGLFGFIGSLLMKLLNGFSYLLGWFIGTLIILAIGGALTVWGILALGNAMRTEAMSAGPETIICVEHVTIDHVATCVEWIKT